MLRFRNAAPWAVAAILALMAMCSQIKPAHAVDIEGTTTAGNYRSVLVTNDGYLYVNFSSASLSHIVVDSGTVSANLLPKTYLNQISGQVTVTNSVAQVFVSSVTRCNTLICNQDPSSNIFFGTNTVTSTTGQILFPKSCASLDGPGCFTGAISAISTGTMISNSLLWWYALP